MGDTRKQINVRLSAEGEVLLDRLQAAVHARLGIKPSQSDIVHLALVSLAADYAPDSPPIPPPPPLKPAGRPKSKKPKTD